MISLSHNVMTTRARTHKPKPARPMTQRFSFARKEGEEKTTQQHPGRGVHTTRRAALPCVDALSQRTSDDPSILIIGYHQGEERAPDPKPPHPAAQRTSAARKEGEEKAVQQCSRRDMRTAWYRARAPSARRTSAPAV